MASQQFLGQILQASSSAANNNDVSSQLAELLSVDLSRSSTSAQVGALQGALSGATDAQLLKTVEDQKLFDGDWPAFESTVVSYLKYCRDLDPWSILKSHDLILTFFNDLAVAFMNTMHGNQLSTVMYNTVRYMMPLIKRVDVVLNAAVPGKKFKRLIFVSSVLSKLFNHVRALKGRSSKKVLTLFIANNLNKIYFIIDSPLLCQNIFANMNLLDHKFSQYPKAQQVEYRYILGRYYLIKNQIINSFTHLNWAFTHAPRSEQKNILKILRYLIPVSLLAGRIPSKRVITQYPELHHHYTPLIIHMKTGNLFAFEQHLSQNQEYFKQKHILILLAQRSRILIFRNLFLNVQRTHPTSNRLTFIELQAALRKSIRSPQEQQHAFNDQFLYQTLDESVDIPFVENVCSSLIENYLMKGNLATKNQLVVLSRSDGFPDVFSTYQRIYGGGNGESWMDE